MQLHFWKEPDRWIKIEIKTGYRDQLILKLKPALFIEQRQRLETPNLLEVEFNKKIKQVLNTPEINLDQIAIVKLENKFHQYLIMYPHTIPLDNPNRERALNAVNTSWLIPVSVKGDQYQISQHNDDSIKESKTKSISMYSGQVVSKHEMRMLRIKLLPDHIIQKMKASILKKFIETMEVNVIYFLRCTLLVDESSDRITYDQVIRFSPIHLAIFDESINV
jgi:hypothetical protein